MTSDRGRPARHAILVFGAAVLLTAPVVAQTPRADRSVVPAAIWRPRPRPAVIGTVTGQSVVYAAETSTGYVNEYPADSASAPTQPIFTFNLDPGTESALVTDPAGDLFLADPYSTWVYEYAPGAATPTKRFPTSMTPSFVSIFGTTLYVFQGMAEGGTANILVYGNGSTTPTRILSDPAINYAQGMAVDGSGNLFVGYGGASLDQYGVGVFVHGQMPMHALGIPHAIYPTALAVDSVGELLVISPSTTNTYRSVVSVFAPRSVTPKRMITNLPAMSELSFAADGKSFYVADSYGHAFGKYAYPSCRKIYDITDPDTYREFGFSGVAVWPPLAPGTW